jgi:hypothetical protein
MRVRIVAAIAGFVLLGALFGLAGTPRDATARLQDASPEAQADGTPEAGTDEPAAVVTLVAFYQQDVSGDFLTIGPVATNDVGVARPGTDGFTGRANFNDPDNDDLPRITLGDSVFDAYPLDPDDPDTVFRWLYLNDEQGERPATLVMQIECTDSPAYEGYTGTATFVSRASEAGGVLVIVLNPPADEEEE